ncbi:MAG: hypothetical protein ACREQY_10230 [Candidatus Binatia bacterium]
MSGDRDDFRLSLWTNDPGRARAADLGGVDRIGLDLETVGKAARQAGLGTWISRHTLDDLPAIRSALRRARLFVRCDPYGPHSRGQVERLVDAGVAVIMLPNFEDPDVVLRFLDLVRGRAEVVPLLERMRAAERADRLASIAEIREIHVGINDLAVDLALTHRIAVYASPVLDAIATAVTGAGKRLGIGGLGRAFDVDLPVPSDCVYAQYPRLRANGALLSRSFFRGDLPDRSIAPEVAKLRSRIRFWADRSETERAIALEALRSRVGRTGGAPA